MHTLHNACRVTGTHVHVHFRQEVSGSEGLRNGQFASCWKNLAECNPHSLSFGAL